MTRFNEVVKSKSGSCAKCFSMTYSLPCLVDIKLPAYLNGFGLPVYSVEVTKLIHIESVDGFKIEARIGSKIVKFTMPKRYEKVDPSRNTRRIEFERGLAEWISDNLNIQIDY